jgi:hypothetical protein
MLERIFPVGTNAKWHGLPDTISAETRTAPGVCVRQTLVIQARKLGARIMRYELADCEWVAIKPMLPNKPRGVPRVNDRRVLNGIFWVLRSGTLARFAGSFWSLHDLL